jgi:hypothetical protein
LIKTTNIKNLIPEFLLESEHFFTCLLDVEGNVLSASNTYVSDLSVGGQENFIDQLDRSSQILFSEVLEQLLGSPKEKMQILLTPKVGREKNLEALWWEFSVITDCEMDILGVIGVGVDLSYFEQEMPCMSLMDLLLFGKIRLNLDLIVVDFDDKVGDWLAIGSPDSVGSGEQFLSEIPQKLEQLRSSKKPSCLVLKDSHSGIEFSAIFLILNSVPHLLILPRARASNWENLVLPFSDAQLNSMTGAVWVINSAFEFVQQNEAASKTVEVWTGRYDAHSFSSILRSNPDELKRLSKFFRKAFEGKPSDIELKINPINLKASYWYVGIKPIFDSAGLVNTLLVNGIELNRLSKRLSKLESENNFLKELVMKPSHILRSPLSSMLGLLDLIDPNQLDSENQKYFSYLKPLAKKLDEVIRTNAKQISSFD